MKRRAPKGCTPFALMLQLGVIEENSGEEMKIYDISQEVFGCEVYPNDPKPIKNVINDMSRGDLYNLTEFSMCAHNGTHIDAPSHFIADGKSVDEILLEKTVGYAYVAELSGDMDERAALELINRAERADKEAAKRLLIKGFATVTEAAARVFAEKGIYLVGNEAQTVGPESSPMAVHKILLSAEVVLLEGIRLSQVEEGVYFLSAAPLNLGGADGSPCWAFLIEKGF